MSKDSLSGCRQGIEFTAEQRLLLTTLLGRDPFRLESKELAASLIRLIKGANTTRLIASLDEETVRMVVDLLKWRGWLRHVSDLLDKLANKIEEKTGLQIEEYT